MYPARSLKDRFDRKTAHGPGCMEWCARRSPDGYGQIQQDKHPVNAHRVAYELYRGPIPNGMTIDHLCRNRGCVNAEHMEVVTNAVNVLRGTSFAAVNAKKTHCVNGHLLDHDNTYRYPTALGKHRGCKTCRRERTKIFMRGYRLRRQRALVEEE